jgi:hypothetical protein
LQHKTFKYYRIPIYSDKENFITIHGIKSEVYAKDIVFVLKDNAKYKLSDPAIVISGRTTKSFRSRKLRSLFSLKNQ